jgi:hypothetical protein
MKFIRRYELGTISITEELCLSPHPDQCASQLEQAQVIHGLPLLWYQEAATFRQP